LQFDGGEWDNKYDIIFYGVHEETDKEFAARMKQIDKEKEAEKAKMDKHKAYIAAEAKKWGLLK